MIYNDFKKNEKIKWCACDTETYTYIDGVKVSNEQLEALGKEKPQAWFREHASVKVYAWLISNGLNFAFCETFNEFIDFICEHKIKACWWYNAKFDFAQIDYEMLSGINGVVWQLNNENDKTLDCSYSSLHNDMGARYSLKMWKKYKGKGRGADRHEHVHAFTNYDFCNIFAGGLAKNLEAFNVVDFEGKPLRKLTMDYQENTKDGKYTKEALDYMQIDVKGLYHLIRIASAFTEDKFNITIAGNKPEIMTAGGLAKQVLLRHLFKYTDKRLNVLAFKSLYSMTIDLDNYFRETKLYEGGICTCNETFQNRLVLAKFYRYDVNSMYPAQMDKMPALIGKPIFLTPKEFTKFKDVENYEIIYELKSYQANLKLDKIPVMRDYLTNEFASQIYFDKDLNGFYKCFFKREIDEYLKWYDIDLNINRYILIRKRNLTGYHEFVTTYYEMKAQAKREHNDVMKQFSKLLLNSSYGKLAERPERVLCHRELNQETGAIHLINDGVTIDGGSLLSVVQGALVSCMGRITLLSETRAICKEDVKRNFIYCDTDSVHTFTKYDNTDDYILGKMKLEAECCCGKWLAPKTYFEMGNDGELELHSKGLPIKAIRQYATNNKLDINSPDVLNQLYKAGAKYQALAGMNIKGGKALIPVMKELCCIDNTSEEKLTYSNYTGTEELFEP